MDLSVSQIKTLAPDSASFSAGEKLSKQNWQTSGRSSRALWGEIFGSGSKPYQVRVDLREFAYRCSCPSRKLPCKHVLGLLLRAAGEADIVPLLEEPGWLVEWLTQRDERAQKKSEKVIESSGAVSTEASLEQQKKRADQRMSRVRTGLDQYRLWLNDLVRSGLAGLEMRSDSIWDEEARRLVDAQLPGLASAVRALGDLPGSDPDWGGDLLGELGKSALLCEAFSRLDQLPDDLQSEIKQQLGWTVSQKDLEIVGEQVNDTWLMLGQYTESGPKIETQYNWYWGCSSKRFLLCLQFAVGQQGFTEIHLPGSLSEGNVVFWPGTERLRGRFLTRETVLDKKGLVLLKSDLPDRVSLSVSEFLDQIAEMSARQPWRASFPAFIKDVIVRPLEMNGNKWRILDKDGRILLLNGKEHWRLCALSAAKPISLFGQWSRQKLTPLSVWRNGHFEIAVTNGGQEE